MSSFSGSVNDQHNFDASSTWVKVSLGMAGDKFNQSAPGKDCAWVLAEVPFQDKGDNLNGTNSRWSGTSRPHTCTNPPIVSSSPPAGSRGPLNPFGTDASRSLAASRSYNKRPRSLGLPCRPASPSPNKSEQLRRMSKLPAVGVLSWETRTKPYAGALPKISGYLARTSNSGTGLAPQVQFSFFAAKPRLPGRGNLPVKPMIYAFDSMRAFDSSGTVAPGATPAVSFAQMDLRIYNGRSADH
ncbi:hypothetical protein BJV78DRAFT_1151726 [Lactifluus subvellereus]|nr:hypothetical protein BJV78DRAFT_1151726 [Lactifluus subvellereus]